MCGDSNIDFPRTNATPAKAGKMTPRNQARTDNGRRIGSAGVTGSSSAVANVMPIRRPVLEVLKQNRNSPGPEPGAVRTTRSELIGYQPVFDQPVTVAAHAPLL